MRKGGREKEEKEEEEEEEEKEEERRRKEGREEEEKRKKRKRREEKDEEEKEDACVWRRRGGDCKELEAPTKIGSLMKKMGVLLPTRSQLPSSVYILMAKPRGSRAVSAEPLSPPVNV